ncbi:sodium channel modifier 1 [Brienomyrus brachyistius]|uniref:sodium channel modifier 1 n=1 Tax=Brienomyrus brachyistius TaxID=42636 RepID=UPI0020B234D0|nr:sodium channel modifier 1 [Brienomyrus brachyistius]
MSFKREGDDPSQLNILKKRRVADLLSNFIPEDEAALMKNGRYTCLVCSYRPVFDTVDMLTVHRKGKRHLEGLKWFYGKKEKFRNEIEKRRHHAYVQAEEQKKDDISPAPLLTQTRKITHHALLKSTPYSSCHKKTSTMSEKQSSSHPDCKRLCYPKQATEAAARISEESTALPSNSSIAVPQKHHSPAKKKQVSKKISCSTGVSEPGTLSMERRRELEHYLKLKSSGWVQDRCGNWVKDDNVEFDSDEDQPAPLLPSSKQQNLEEPEKL